ncbi:MAG: pirin family protein [Thermoplasmata archaeon]
MVPIKGEIDTTDVSVRRLFPTSKVKEWLPYKLFGETIATSRKRPGAHSHAAEEVVTYVLEGYVDYVGSQGPQVSLHAGCVLTLTASATTSHELAMRKGRTARWIGITLPITLTREGEPPVVQTSEVSRPEASPDGSISVPVIGTGGPVRLKSGLNLADVAFVEEGTAFVRAGADRRTIVYSISGSGSVDQQHVHAGNGVLLDGVGAIALQGLPGFRVIVASAPVRS